MSENQSNIAKIKKNQSKEVAEVITGVIGFS